MRVKRACAAIGHILRFQSIKTRLRKSLMQQQFGTRHFIDISFCVTDEEFPRDVHQAVNNKFNTGHESLGRIHHIWWLFIHLVSYCLSSDDRRLPKSEQWQFTVVKCVQNRWDKILKKQRQTNKSWSSVVYSSTGETYCLYSYTGSLAHIREWKAELVLCGA